MESMGKRWNYFPTLPTHLGNRLTAIPTFPPPRRRDEYLPNLQRPRGGPKQNAEVGQTSLPNTVVCLIHRSVWCSGVCTPHFCRLGLFGDLLCLNYDPVVSLILLLLVFRRKGRQRFSALSALAVFVILTIILFKNFPDTRDAVRWLVYGPKFRARTLAQSNPDPSSLKHTEWEAWGFPGAGDTVVYLVFDPTDSLAAAAKRGASGKFGNLPCAVVRVRRRQKEWYTVRFYTETDWEHCTS
jgi:hypothetical protein